MQLSEFMKVTNSTRMAKKTKDAVRLVLVDGMRTIDAANQMEMSRQQVQNAVVRVETAYKAAQGVPADWVCITVCVPAEQINTVRKFEQAEKKKAGLIGY